MKRILSIILITFMIILPLTALADENNVYSYEDLKKIYEEQSKVEEEIKLEHELTKSQYEDGLDDYADLEEGVQELDDQKIILKQQLDQNIEEQLDEEDEDPFEEYILDLQMNGLTNGYGTVLTIYENLVRQQINLYSQMELLKVQLDSMDKQLHQNKIVAENDFDQLCYDYYLLQQEQTLVVSEKELLDEELENLKQQFSLGTVTMTEVHQKENEGLQLKEKENRINNELEKKYMELIQVLGLSLEDQPVFDINEEDMKYDLDGVIEYVSFETVAKNNNLMLATLDRQLEVYNEIEDLIKTAYDENEEEYEMLMLENEINKKNTAYNIQQIDLMFRYEYNGYEIAKKQFEINQKTYDIAVKDYETAKQKYDQGMISDYEWLEAQYDHELSKFSYDQSIANFIEAHNSFIEAIYGKMEMPNS
ncbi:TolC family protein [Vallitalea okinawensis]|uniref:TolC family protein n=1 Tax=Vallitalea okinawensis TaxID=2078660 RepID=UPI000CFAF31D|nr:TolC family protein [Vallitalea okinawensis]